MSKFKQLVDTEVNKEFSTGFDITTVESISFHRNLIILRKRESTHRARKYRYRNKLGANRIPDPR